MTPLSLTSLYKAVNDVRDFHEVTDTPIRHELLLIKDRVALRMRLLNEEHEELQDALAEGNIVEVADGLADLIYVAIGTALELGIPLEAVWAEVHRTNMAKVDPATGKVLKRPDGKVIKPEGWTPPNIRAILYGDEA